MSCSLMFIIRLIRLFLRNEPSLTTDRCIRFGMVYVFSGDGQDDRALLDITAMTVSLTTYGDERNEPDGTQKTLP